MRLDNQFWSCSFCLPACQQLIDTLHWTIDDNYTVLLQRLKKGKNKQNGQHFLGWKKNATAVKDRGRFWHRWVRWSARLNPSPINPNYVNQPPSFFANSSHVDTHERIAIHHHLIRDTSRISADIRSSVATHTRLTTSHLRGPLQSLEMCVFLF